MIRFLAILYLLISGCQSGGSGTSASATVNQLSSWNSVSHPSEVTASGVAYEGTFTYNTSTGAITSVGGATAASTPKVVLTYDSNGNLTKAVVSTGSQTQTFDKFQNANSNGTLIFGLKDTDSNDWALATEPLHANVNWKYQSIAVWTEPDNGSGKYGGTSVGAQTEGSSIPSGNATFSGFAGGFYSDASNNIYVVQSDLSATANFGTNSVAISATNTGKQLYNGNDGSFGTYANDANLNFSGTLTYPANTNTLTGTITTTSGMSGPSQSKFYGPNANEIGGAFNLTGGGKTYVGAFGAKQ